MKNFILTLILFISSFAFSQDVTVVHFNYEWNSRNGFKKLDNLKSAKVQYAYVESQSKSLRESIKSVPTIIIYKGDKPVPSSTHPPPVSIPVCIGVCAPRRAHTCMYSTAYRIYSV